MSADEIVLDLQLRSRDLDQLGHLNHAVYHELLEEGRIALFRRAWPDGRPRFVLAHIELDHRAEVRLDHGPVRLVQRLVGMGRSSVEIHHELRRADGTLAAEGRSVLVAWDTERRGARPLSDAEREALGGQAAADAAGAARSA